MDRFQLTVRREHCPAPMLPCAPVQSIEEGTGVISLGAVGDSGEGLEKRSIPGLRGALLPYDWCLISYQTSPVVSRPTFRPSALPLVALTPRVLVPVFYSCSQNHFAGLATVSGSGLV